MFWNWTGEPLSSVDKSFLSEFLKKQPLTESNKATPLLKKKKKKKKYDECCWQTQGMLLVLKREGIHSPVWGAAVLKAAVKVSPDPKLIRSLFEKKVRSYILSE